MSVYEPLRDPIALTVFVATLLLPVVIGLGALLRTRDQEDFLIGGRAMGRLVVALSAVSSGRSSWLILGVSGLAYSTGVAAIWAVAGYTTVEFVQCLLLGPRLRRASGDAGALTLLDYFESRFPDSPRMLRVSGATIIVSFTIAYVAAQLSGGARTLHNALDWPLGWGLLAAAGLIVVYMMLGGYIAVAYNDVARALIMAFGLVVLPVALLVRSDGPAALTTLLAALDPSLVDPTSLGLGALAGLLGIGLGSPGQPHILIRYMSIDDPSRLRSVAWITLAWNSILGSGAVLVGLLGRVAFADVEELPSGDPEMVYLALSAGGFEPVLYGLLVGGVFAAILSTADSQLLVVASTFVRDVWERGLRRGHPIDERSRLRLSRIVVAISGGLALALAYTASDLVFWLVLFAWSGLGAALGPPLVLALFDRRTRRQGVVAGMWTGALVTVVWRLWLKEPTGVYELLPAFAAAWLVTVAVSRSTGGGDRGGGR